MLHARLCFLIWVDITRRYGLFLIRYPQPPQLVFLRGQPVLKRLMCVVYFLLNIKINILGLISSHYINKTQMGNGPNFSEKDYAVPEASGSYLFCSTST